MVARYSDTPTVLRRGEPVTTKLHRIAEKARREPQFRFTSLHHLLQPELLEGCHQQLSSRAAAGIDGVTKKTYSTELSVNVSILAEQLQQMGYRPQPERRDLYIPKPGTDKQRPQGVPAYEHKLVQTALVAVLENIYEVAFCSMALRTGYCLSSKPGASMAVIRAGLRTSCSVMSCSPASMSDRPLCPPSN